MSFERRIDLPARLGNVGEKRKKEFHFFNTSFFKKEENALKKKKLKDSRKENWLTKVIIRST